MTTPWITPSSRERPTAPTHAHQVGVFEREEAAASHSLDSAAGPPMWRRGSLSGRSPVLRGYRVRAALGRLGMPCSIGATVRPAVCWDHSQTWAIGRAKAASTCFTTSTPAQLRSAKSPLPSLGGAPVGPHRVPLASHRCAACKSTALPCVHARCPLPLRLNVPQRPTPGRHSVRDPPTGFGCALFQGEEARRTLDVACARPIVST